LIFGVPFILQQLLRVSIGRYYDLLDQVYIVSLGPAFSIGDPSTEQEIIARFQQIVHVL
jgi:hypothetical protein